MANSSLAIGVDIGGTKVLGGVVDTNGSILRTFREDTPRDGGDALNQVIASVVTELQTTHKTEHVGISAAGLVSSDRQTMLGAPNIKDWDGVNIAKALNKICGINSIVENDANSAAWAERVYGAGKGQENVIMITVGTGLGGYLVENVSPQLALAGVSLGLIISTMYVWWYAAARLPQANKPLSDAQKIEVLADLESPAE